MIELTAYTQEQLRKADFVRGELTMLLTAADESIVSCVFHVTSEGEELVDVIYRNHYHRNVCVSADSLMAIALDVLRAVCF